MNAIKSKNFRPLIAVILVTLAISAISLGVSPVWLNPLELFDPDSAYFGILRLRLVRTCTAFIVGGALATSGLAYQAVLRNPLAEPYILGVSGGASLGAALSIMLGLSAITMFAIPVSAFICGLTALGVVLLMSRRKMTEYSESVLLSGVIVGSVCSSLLMFIISGLGFGELNSITWWMLGNMQDADIRLLNITGVITIAGTLLLFTLGREANVLCLGEEMAYHMGIAPMRAVLILLGTASLMTAAAVSLAGIISFVGLVVPHILRRLFGADHRRLFPLGLFCGGAFLMLCDTVSRSLLTEREIPVGVITALVGGPFFIWLLNRRSPDLMR